MLESRNDGVAQVTAIQCYLVNLLLPSLSASYGETNGIRLSEGILDRLFARPLSLAAQERFQADRLCADLLRQNEVIRIAVLTSLRALHELESERNNLAAKRRIEETIEWLKQFGEIPAESSLTEVFEVLKMATISKPWSASETDLPESSSDADRESKIRSTRGPLTIESERPEGETWQIT